jgi:hypothetical protein
MPQCVYTPNFASLTHSGSEFLARDPHVGSKCCCALLSVPVKTMRKSVQTTSRKDFMAFLIGGKLKKEDGLLFI